MSTLHIVLVCHTELDFSGSWRLYEYIQPEIDALISRVEDASGKKPKITYCLTGAFLSERLDDAFRFLEEGHEIGIHSHLPGSHRPRHRYDGPYAYRFDEKGMLNQDAVAGPLRQIAISLGLPAPRTHVSGMFTFQQSTIKCLVDAGFSVDCSLLPGVKGTHDATGDFILADNRRRKDPYPYRPSLDDPWADGHSSIIELPVSGNLGSSDINQQISDVEQRVQELGKPDVFQSFWHHFEFVKPGPGSFEDSERFLTKCALHDSIQFSTASEAADALQEYGL